MGGVDLRMTQEEVQNMLRENHYVLCDPTLSTNKKTDYSF